MEGKTGRTKGKENTCRTVGITKALADSGHSTARKGFFYFFALKFGYSIETKNPNASPIRKVFGLFVCGRSDRIRTCGIDVPNVARYQLRHTPFFDENIQPLYYTSHWVFCQYQSLKTFVYCCSVTIDVLHHEKRIAINRAPSRTSDDSRGCMKHSDLLFDFLAFYNFRMLF